MPIDKNKCKLCSKSFINGRALGGHMRSHLLTTSLPLKKITVSDSSSNQTRSQTENNNVNSTSKISFYELRDNPKKSAKILDPQFLDEGPGSIVVIQDRESETESTQNPTRKRSKRTVTSRVLIKRCKSPVSSVSNPPPLDEEVALCLMMLSRDVWARPEPEPEPTTRARARVVAKYKCYECKKVFRSGRALDGHKASNKECSKEIVSDDVGLGLGRKIFECPFCSKVFGSGQALGGHKRSHLIGVSSNNNNVNVNVNDNVNVNVNDETTTTTTTSSFVLDLNMPAPIEDDDEDYTCRVDFESTLNLDVHNFTS